MCKLPPCRKFLDETLDGDYKPQDVTRVQMTLIFTDKDCYGGLYSTTQGLVRLMFSLLVGLNPTQFEMADALALLKVYVCLQLCLTSPSIGRGISLILG